MAKFKHHSRLIEESRIISSQAIIEGMILSFSYTSTRAGAVTSDFTPIVLVLYRDRKKGVIEGVNLNYIPITKVKKLFKMIGTRLRSKILTDEKIPGISTDFTRVQISSQRRRSNITPEKFKVLLNTVSYKWNGTTKVLQPMSYRWLVQTLKKNPEATLEDIEKIIEPSERALRRERMSKEGPIAF